MEPGSEEPVTDEAQGIVWSLTELQWSRAPKSPGDRQRTRQSHQHAQGFNGAGSEEPGDGMSWMCGQSGLSCFNGAGLRRAR